MQQSKNRGCIKTAAVVSILLRCFFVHSLCVHSAIKETHFVVAFFRSLSVHCQRPSGGVHVAIGRWSRGHRSMFTWPSGGGRWKFREKNGNHRGKNEKSRRSSIPWPGICCPMLVRKGVGILRKKCTASCSGTYGSAKQSGKYSGCFHRKFSGQDNILGVFRVFANSNNGKCAVHL